MLQTFFIFIFSVCCVLDATDNTAALPLALPQVPRTPRNPLYVEVPGNNSKEPILLRKLNVSVIKAQVVNHTQGLYTLIETNSDYAARNPNHDLFTTRHVAGYSLIPAPQGSMLRPQHEAGQKKCALHEAPAKTNRIDAHAMHPAPTAKNQPQPGFLSCILSCFKYLEDL